MDSDEEKIPLGGISCNTDENRLKEYFSKLGDVLKVTVIRKPTSRSKGYGFVSFSDPIDIDSVLQDKHQIDNREVDVERRTSREEQKPAERSGNFNSSTSLDSGVNARAKKIFVGGLSPSLTLQEFRAYFEKYGPVSDAVIMIDQPTQRPRGFGFVSFYSEDSVDGVLHKTLHCLNGNRVEVKRAIPKDANLGVASGGGGTGVFLGNVGAGEASGGGGAGAADCGGGAGAASDGGGVGAADFGDGGGAASGGGGGVGAFPVYGCSGGNRYEGHKDSNRYMQPQNTGSGYPPYGASGYGHGSYGVGYGGYGWYGNPPYGASGYGHGSYGVGYGGYGWYGYPPYGASGNGHGSYGVGYYGYPAGMPYGNPGVLEARGPSSSRDAQEPSGYGNVEYGNASREGGSDPGSAVMEQVGGSAVNDSSNGSLSAYGAVDGSGGGYPDASNDSGGYENHQANSGQDAMVEVVEKMGKLNNSD